MGDLAPKGAATVAPPESAKLIGAPHVHIWKSDSELRHDTGTWALRGQAKWGPILKGSRAKKVEFLSVLSRAGLLAWGRWVRCRA
eukprot:6312726-Pyramimonas_sp.AAC.1